MTMQPFEITEPSSDGTGDHGEDAATDICADIDDSCRSEARTSKLLRGSLDLIASTCTVNVDKEKLSGTEWKEMKIAEEEEDDDDTMETLVIPGGDEWGESTYTLLYLCDGSSQGFWYGLFVYGLQMTTISVTLVDIIDFSGMGNALRVPPMVDQTVTVAQGVALFLAMAYQSDLIEAVIKLQNGFYPQVLEKRPGASLFTWIFACTAQLGAGFLLLTTIFVLTIQVDSVLAIMLNFAALHFMAEIDDLGFALAKMGFVNNLLYNEVCTVEEFQVPKRKQLNFTRRVLYWCSLVGLFVGFTIMKKRQLDGYYLQTYVYVQFGDAYDAKAHYYSGLMYSENIRTSGHRVYSDLATRNIHLAYCLKEDLWTFSLTYDPCDYFARSKNSKTYDVTRIRDSDWEIYDSLGRLQPFDSFSLRAKDCLPDMCQGECIDGLCHCPNGHFGMDCEFDNVCPRLVLHGDSGPFPPATEAQWAIGDEFHIFQDSKGDYVKVNYMPVYYSNQTFSANVIFFGGRRWVITGEISLFEDPDALYGANPKRKSFPEVTAGILNDPTFHGHDKATYDPYFLSDPVDYGTPGFLPTPALLGWSTVGILDAATREYGQDVPVATILTCADCSASGGSCFSAGGTCNEETGLCECMNLYHGPRCELRQACYELENPCSGRGICDQISGVCRCRLPWYGKLCMPVYYCYEEKGNCRNGGQCRPDEGNFCDCSMDPAITGYSCEKRKDCKVFGCEHGGVCDEATRRCDCPEPYHGVLCGVLNETQREDICSEENTTQYGTLCEDQNHCTNHGCRNDGVCNGETGLCECQKPWIGRDCAELPDCATDEDCGAMGGFCVFTGFCDCVRHGFGKLCEDTFDCHEDGGCNNGGFCNLYGFCECPDPYTGPRCEQILDDKEYIIF